MRARLFEDLVVSAPPAGRFGRRAALLPVSIAAHAGALAAALLLPALPSGVLPEPITQRFIWKVPSAPSPPPVVAAAPPAPRVRSEARTREPMPAIVADPIPPPPAPGPTMPIVEPDGLPTDEGPPPCLVNCEGADPHGVGNGPKIGHDGPGGSDGTGPPIVRPGGLIKAPIRTVYVAPVYPEIARMARVMGMVVLECTIDPSGRVTDVRIVTGHPLLNEAALNAVRQWRYTATRLNDVPVAVLMTVTVHFKVN
jgi:protein TonB